MTKVGYCCGMGETAASVEGQIDDVGEVDELDAVFPECPANSREGDWK